MKVAVTGAGALLGQGIIRSLRRGRLAPQVLALDPSPLAAGLYWADEAALVPLASDPTYLDRLATILRRAKPDALLVGTDVELPLLARHRTMIEGEFGGVVVVSDPRVVEIADDKYLTAEFFRGESLPHPASCLPGDVEDLIATVGFPLIVKPRIGARSIGVVRVGDRSALTRALAEATAPIVIQEDVGSAGAEYTAGVLVFDDVAQASIVMRRDLRDGNTYRAFSDDYADLNRSVRHMSERLRPFGPANFQFRLDRAGAVKVFEINARFSGTTPLRALAGFDEVEMCLRHLVLDEPVVQPEIQRLTILRHWSETVVRPDQLLCSP